MEKKNTDAAKKAEMAKKAAAAQKAAAAKKSSGNTKSAPAKKETPKKTDVEKTEVAVEETREEKPARQTTAERSESVKGLRVGAIVLWILALACEVGAFFVLNRMALNNFNLQLTDPMVLLFGGLIILDAILCVVAAQLWKKSNRIRPCLNNSAFVRTLWHQLGVIMAMVCLLPIGIIFLLKSKDMKNKKLRTILLVALALIFAGTTAASVDYKQPTPEEVQELQEAVGATDETTVYWTKWGKSYHMDENCQALRNSTTVTSGPLGGVDDEGNIVDMGGESAFENNRFDPCDFCAGGGDVEEPEA